MAAGCWGMKVRTGTSSLELQESEHGCGLQKASQAKDIYGLEPVLGIRKLGQIQIQV